MSRPARLGLLIVGLLAATVLPPVAAGLATAVPAGAAGAGGLPSSGYRLIAGDGGVFAFGTAYLGAPSSDPARCPRDPDARSMPDGSCWSMATTPDDRGYYVLDAFSGDVYTYGDAVSYGQPADSFGAAGADLWPTSLAMAVTPDGKGYWILELGLSGMASVQAFGDAVSYGDPLTSRITTVGAPVGIVGTTDGKGYWIAFSDGGVFAYGDARFAGSMGGHPLAAKVVGMARTPDSGGYWLVGADGGVFALGGAPFAGSMAGQWLAAPVFGISAPNAVPAG